METTRYRVAPGTDFRLSEVDPHEKVLCPGGKKEARPLLSELRHRLRALQARLYAEGRHALLVVLQGRNAAGKDGTIRHVFRGVNPQGVEVASFKVPTARERAHDYLWRIHARCPPRGRIVIFNRSHYEDVLVPRVEGTVPPEHIDRRYRHIVEFERMLSEEGTRILKFFLHVSKEEQRRRLQARLDRPEKRWKFKRSDLEQRAKWDLYTEAYEAMLSRTSTAEAPWHVVPADRKWYRNLVVAQVIVAALEALDPEWPAPEGDLPAVVAP